MWYFGDMFYTKVITLKHAQNVISVYCDEANFNNTFDMVLNYPHNLSYYIQKETHKTLIVELKVVNYWTDD